MCHQDNEQTLEGAAAVYMHSSAVLFGETGPLPYNWQHTIAFNGTGANGQAPIFTKVSDNEFTFTFNPSEFYGIEAGNTIVGIYAVFNDGAWNSRGGREFNPDGSGTCVDFFIPLNYPNPVPSFNFKCNMNKMIDDGNFLPAEDLLYVVIDELGTFEMLDYNVDGIYNVLVTDNVVQGTVYHFKFRINTDQLETVNREITAIGGLLNFEAWWNDVIGKIFSDVTFKVDMTYQMDLGKFNPSGGDFVDVAGSFNNWAPPAGEYHLAPDAGNANIYDITIPQLEAGVTYEFKFRINGSWNDDTCEFPHMGPNRKYTPLTWATTVSQLVYNNYKPGWVPVNLCCIMDYYLQNGDFDPVNNAKFDRLDVAGTFNNWGGEDILYQGDDTYFHTSVLAEIGSTIEYKFRYHSAWDGTNELDGSYKGRMYTVLDTAGGVVNDVPCSHYNPSRVDNLMLTGKPVIDSTLTASYEFADLFGNTEEGSQYQWYRSTDEQGTDFTPIADQTGLTYTITEDDYKKMLKFYVLPCNNIPECGAPDWVITEVIFHEGIGDTQKGMITMYPNPAGNTLTFENIKNVSRITVFNLTGQKMLDFNNLNTGKLIVNTSLLTQGVYFVTFYNDNSLMRTDKFMKD